MVRRMLATILGCVLPGLVFSGCQPSVQGLSQRLQGEDPAVRAAAARQAGAEADAAVAPLLVDRLTDSEPEVRFFAILALERIAGTRMGYCYYHTVVQRQAAVDAWRQWLAQRAGQSASRPASGPATGPGRPATDRAAGSRPTEGAQP